MRQGRADGRRSLSGLDSAAVAEVDTAQLERVLGPDWQAMSYMELSAGRRERL